MKKFVALLLALLLVLVNVAALAEDGPNTEDLSDKIDNLSNGANRTAGSPDPVITKKYTTEGSSTSIYPVETLEFTVTPPDDDAPEITIGYDGTETGKAKNTYATTGTETIGIPVNVPDANEYGEAGRYHYEIVETNPQTDPSQGETYSTTKFNVDVYITYKIVDDKVTDELVKEVVIYSGDEKTEDITTKEDTFDNKYELGKLTITKTISGNLADPDMPFTIKVILTAGKDVNSDITVTQPNSDGIATSTTVDKGWKGTKTIEVVVKGGQSATIENIPSGVTYSVEETKAGDKNITMLADNEASTQINAANDLSAYYVEYGTAKATAGPAEGEITKDGATVAVKNTKEITVPTGISLEKLPYVLILAVAVMGAAVLVIRKREEY